MRGRVVPHIVEDEEFELRTKESLVGDAGRDEVCLRLFGDVTRVALACNVFEPTGSGYERDPRYIAEKAEAYLVATGIADKAFLCNAGRRRRKSV